MKSAIRGFVAAYLLSAPLLFAGPAGETRVIDRKLTAIIIPSIEFRSTTLPDAVEFLRQESRRLDNTTGDPAERGLNILLPPSDAAKNTRITLALSQIPVREALRYIAAQAGLKLKVEPYAVSLVPLSDPSEALVTAVISVKPDFFGPVDPNAAPPAQ